MRLSYLMPLFVVVLVSLFTFVGHADITVSTNDTWTSQYSDAPGKSFSMVFSATPTNGTMTTMISAPIDIKWEQFESASILIQTATGFTSGDITNVSFEVSASPKITSGSETTELFFLERANNADTAVWTKFPTITKYGNFTVPAEVFGGNQFMRIKMSGTGDSVSRRVDITLR